MVLHGESRQLIKTKIDAESLGNAFYAEKIVAIGRYLNLVHILLRQVDSVAIAVHTVHLHFFRASMLHLDTEIEAKVLKLVLSCARKNKLVSRSI